MLDRQLEDRITVLIDDLLRDGGTEEAFLASILLNALDAVRGGSYAAVARRFWDAYHEPGGEDGEEPPTSG